MSANPAPTSDTHQHPIIIFDGVCNLCAASVIFIIKHDRQAKFRFAAAQSEAGQRLQAHYGFQALTTNTMLLIKNDQVYTQSSAALEIAQDLEGAWKYLALFKWLPQRLRDWGYDFVARHRLQWFGVKDQCMIPTPELKQRFLT